MCGRPLQNSNKDDVFDKETFGVDRLVIGQPSRPFNASRDFRPSPADWKAFLDKTPCTRMCGTAPSD